MLRAEQFLRQGGTFSKGLKVLRVTKESHNLQTEFGRRAVTKDVGELLNNQKVHLRASLPCRPWSQGDELNGRKLGKKFRFYVEALREESLVLIEVFINLAKAVIKGGGSVSFEWPAYCVGWNVPSLTALLNDLGFGGVLCHGCAFGLSHRGKPIKKPLRIKSTHSLPITELSNHKCTCPRGNHTPCGGAATSGIKNYTPQMAHTIVDGVLTPGLEHCSASCAESRSFLAIVEDNPTSTLDLAYAGYSHDSMTRTDRALAARFADGEEGQHHRTDSQSHSPFLGLVLRCALPLAYIERRKAQNKNK